MQPRPSTEATSGYVRGGVIRSLQIRIEDWGKYWNLLRSSWRITACVASYRLANARVNLTKALNRQSYMTLLLSQQLVTGRHVLPPGFYNVLRVDQARCDANREGITLPVQLLELPDTPGCVLRLGPLDLDSVYDLVVPGVNPFAAHP